VTKAYQLKIQNIDARDNCAIEFNHALNMKKPMLAVVLERGMLKEQWTGPLGVMWGSLYCDMTGNLDDPWFFNDKLAEVCSLFDSCVPNNKTNKQSNTHPPLMALTIIITPSMGT
jgi:hypothetical protein